MAKKWGQKIRKWLTKQLDLPEDVMMDVPRLTMIGQLHLYIENHKGLISFSEQEIHILLKSGRLVIKGQTFVIKTILPEEILLEGKIDQIIYIND